MGVGFGNRFGHRNYKIWIIIFWVILMRPKIAHFIAAFFQIRHNLFFKLKRGMIPGEVDGWPCHSHLFYRTLDKYAKSCYIKKVL